MQTCIVHLTRFSLAYCSWQDRKAVAGEFYVTRERGGGYVHARGAWDVHETVDAVQHVFGVVGICPVAFFDTQEYAVLKENVIRYIGG